MKIITMYERVPQVPFLELPTKGKPNPAILYRYSRKLGFKDFPNIVKPSTRGGTVTVAFIDSIGNSNWMVTGKAVCSMSDNFSYKTGKKIALLRATNIGLGHTDLNSGLMFRLDDKVEKMDDQTKLLMIDSYIHRYKNRNISSSHPVPNTVYLHPETAKIIPKIDTLTVKVSKIILQNHVWIGFEE